MVPKKGSKTGTFKGSFKGNPGSDLCVVSLLPGGLLRAFCDASIHEVAARPLAFRVYGIKG